MPKVTPLLLLAVMWHAKPMLIAFVETYRTSLDFAGRVGRRRYWQFVFLGYVALIICAFVLGFVNIKLHLGIPTSDLSGVLSLCYGIPYIGLSIQRMHDVGKSGWWILVPFANLFLLLSPSQIKENAWGSPEKRKEDDLEGNQGERRIQEKVFAAILLVGYFIVNLNAYSGIPSWAGGISAHWVDILFLSLTALALVSIYVPELNTRLVDYSIGVGVLQLGAGVSGFFNSEIHRQGSPRVAWLIWILLDFLFVGFVILRKRRSRKLNVVSSPITRIVGSVQILFVLVAFVTWPLAWEKTVSHATSSTWSFKGSGTATIVQYCCTLSQSPTSQNVFQFILLAGLLIMAILASLGKLSSSLMLLPTVIYLMADWVNSFVRLGVQDPSKIWSQSDIDAYGLTSVTSYLPAAYIFASSIVLLLLAVAVADALKDESLPEPSV